MCESVPAHGAVPAGYRATPAYETRASSGVTCLMPLCIARPNRATPGCALAHGTLTGGNGLPRVTCMPRVCHVSCCRSSAACQGKLMAMAAYGRVLTDLYPLMVDLFRGWTSVDDWRHAHP